MKQVFNWTIGSFFRTIGRTIAFLVMGGIIYYILSSNGFEFGLKELFFDNVKADTIQGFNFGDITTNNWNNTSASIGAGQYSQIILESGTLYNERTNFTITNTISGNDIQYIIVNGYIDGIDYTKDQFECDYMTNNGCESWSLSSSAQLEFKLWARGWATPCKIELDEPTLSTINTLYWTATCPYPGNSVSQFYYRFKYSKINTLTTVRLGVNKTVRLIKDSSTQIINSIDTQTQQQQEQHEEVMDSNTTEAEEEASSFFEDFDAPDIGGLGAIITAPLNTIRSLLNSSCSNLVLPLPYVDEDLTLPCMNTIYTEHFGAFFTIYQTIVLALIAYRCIRSIFFDIHGFTNPNDDRIEVMDL